METNVLSPRRTSGKEKTYRARRVYAAVFELLLAALILSLLFFVWLRPVRITGDSMAETLMDGEIVLIDRLARFWKLPERGDMIAFATDEGLFIKRIVALPGETVEIADGDVFIGSVPLDERLYAHGGIDTMPPVTVPEGSVFVLGDNRAKIYDSRLEAVGCIPYTELVGVLRARISPVSRVTLFF